MPRRGWICGIAISIAAAIMSLCAYALITKRDGAVDTAAESRRLGRVMERHDEAMGQWLREVADSLARNDMKSLPQSCASDYSLYVFENGKMRLWHNACLPTANPTPPAIRSPMLEAENGWFYVKSLHRGNLHLSALLRIRSRFPYVNDYLTDRFHPSLRLPIDTDISTDPERGAAVYSPNGAYLFSVTYGPGYAARLTTSQYVLAIIFLALSVACAAAAVVFASVFVSRRVGRWQSLAFAAFGFVTIYMASLAINPPEADGQSTLFSLQFFSFDWWIPSLAYLLLAAGLLTAWSALYFRQTVIRTRHGLAILAASVAPWVAFMLANGLLDTMVRHSQGLSFYVGDLGLTSPTLIKMVIVSLLLMGPCLVFERSYSCASGSWGWRRFGLCALAGSCAAGFAAWLWGWPQAWMASVEYGALCVAFFLMKRASARVMLFSHFIWTLMLLALIAASRLTVLNADKEMAYRKLLSTNLSFQMMREDDPIAEQLLPSVQSALTADTTTLRLMEAKDILHDQIFTHLRNAVFGGYFTRFDLQVIPCRGIGSTIQMTNTGDLYDCLPYFDQLIATHGRKVAGADKFYCIDDGDGRPCYLGVFTFSHTGAPNDLFVQLTRKAITQGVGYPELLINKRDRMDENKLRGYSYAKYADGRLVYRYGAFDYPLVRTSLLADSANTLTQSDGYSHLVCQTSARQTLVVSYPVMTLSHFLTCYSFIFLGMLVLCPVIMLIASHSRRSHWAHMSLSERLHAGLVIFVMILFVLLCAVSSIQSMGDYEQESRNRLSDALQAVEAAMTDELSGVSPRELATNRAYTVEIDNALQRAADPFAADAHLFSADGKLIGTSRREMFMSGLVAPLMNDEAKGMLERGKGEAFVQERIGTLLHYAIYAPLFNDGGELLGYVNVPFFNDVSAMRRQMMSTIVPITNSMMLIILLAIIFSYAMAHGIMRHLTELRDILQNSDIDSRGAKLAYPYDDEVGQIVSAYNKMTAQLHASAERLAATERESTWREMARQVAHEIKNPLTPMKLSVQYLLRIWETRRENFEPMLHKTAQTLIEQIDQLTSVASQFSGIAKMKQAEPEPMDLAARLTATTTLFSRSEDSTLTYDGPKDGVWIMADPDLMTSVFNNLIKNAQQSAKDGRKVDIAVRLRHDGETATVDVTDNGDGIDDNVKEKIFKPNFTTKSKGMGLGLAITKTIVTNSGGQISFTTARGSGTTFTVSLPLLRQD